MEVTPDKYKKKINKKKKDLYTEVYHLTKFCCSGRNHFCDLLEKVFFLILGHKTKKTEVIE